MACWEKNESNHKKYDDTSKDRKLNHYEDSLKKKVTKGVRRMPWLSEAKKDVTSCDKLRGLANTNWSADFRMGQPIISNYDTIWKYGANVGNWNILLPTGKENKSDSQSSGERNGNSLNWCCFGNARVAGLRYGEIFWTGTVLEKPAIAGESPLQVRNMILAVP